MTSASGRVVWSGPAAGADCGKAGPDGDTNRDTNQPTEAIPAIA
jgi:hypothetical protein